MANKKQAILQIETPENTDDHSQPKPQGHPRFSQSFSVRLIQLWLKNIQC